jgi:hypothetical protein
MSRVPPPRRAATTFALAMGAAGTPRHAAATAPISTKFPVTNQTTHGVEDANVTTPLRRPALPVSVRLSFDKSRPSPVPSTWGD